MITINQYNSTFHTRKVSQKASNTIPLDTGPFSSFLKLFQLPGEYTASAIKLAFNKYYICHTIYD